MATYALSLVSESATATARCWVRIVNDTLHEQYRSALLLGTEYDLLGEFGESVPFTTQLFVQTNTGLQKLQQFMPFWIMENHAIELVARGPHAHDLCKRLPGRVEDCLRDCMFDGDGYLIART